ncbi:hypothetical protein [Dokdonella sp.]|uniref:hypothetical protein n=1 Tax=Dokdonella sp. TaxID=2291710 RepID=UPI0025C25707|nr:hypothetical protein [Dokdonella sp.]MBX3687984.1 sel1 repeat family protein [Dokdonella sp.]
MRDHRFLLIAATVLSGAFGLASARSDDPSIVRNASFIAAHPDLFWRERGIFEYTSGHFVAARTDFRRAAGFADKPSQALLAQMLWNGEGGAADRIAAYVWADLAAERAYPDFIATRERMWKELSAQQRGAVQAAGEPVFAQFADAVAKPRLERELRRRRLDVTGSRTGRVGTLSVMAVNPDGTMGPPIDGSLYYAPRYWKPEDYWRWQDQPFKQPPRGHVDVGPVSTTPDQPD